MRQAFKELLHDFKVDAFRFEHNRKDVEAISSECMNLCEEVLQQKYHYHFHKLPDANRAEIINMINNYTREAVLPPVVEKLVHRQVRLEKRFDTLVTLVEKMLETLSVEPNGKAAT